MLMSDLIQINCKWSLLYGAFQITHLQYATPLQLMLPKKAADSEASFGTDLKYTVRLFTFMHLANSK